MQVIEDQKLLKENVQHLSGEAGIERMECALSEARSKYFLAKENGNPSGAQIPHFISPSPPSSMANFCVPSSDKGSHENIAQPSRVVRSLFREDNSPEGSSLSAPRTIVEGHLGSSVEKLVLENELIVNEFLHKRQDAFSDIFSLTDEDQNGVKVSTLVIFW